MSEFCLYIHGVPIGHDICGCNENLDYIKGFYSARYRVNESEVLVIEVLDGKSFYTYLRKKNFCGAEGRTGSYFGLTVSFPGKYCANVYMLYKVLDAIYKQICVGSIINPSREQWLVREIGVGRYNNMPILDVVRSVFDNNMAGLRFINGLEGFAATAGESRFNINEVDSPMFYAQMRNNTVFVSPEYEMAGKRIDELDGHIRALTEENRNLTESNRHLAGEVDRLKTSRPTETISLKRERQGLPQKTIPDAGDAMGLERSIVDGVKAIRTVLKIANLALLLCLFVICCINSCGIKRSRSDIDLLKNKIDSLRKGISLPVDTTTSIGQPPAIVEPDYEICIDNTPSDSVYRKGQYELTLKINGNSIDDNVIWLTDQDNGLITIKEVYGKVYFIAKSNYSTVQPATLYCIIGNKALQKTIKVKK